ncbi:MAG: hypothetical protein ACXW09_15480, partial [Methylococcaceae bacterium]
AETGMTPAKFVEMARIDAARHYLGSTTLSSEAVAEKSGLNNDTPSINCAMSPECNSTETKKPASSSSV